MSGRSRRRGIPREDGQAGRPPLLTEPVFKIIVDCIELLGMPDSYAAQMASISGGSITKWKGRGRRALAALEAGELSEEEQKSEAIYIRFFNALRQSDAMFMSANLTVIQNAAMKGDWRAADRRLQMKFPLIFGKRVMVAGDPQNQTPIAQTTESSSSSLSDEEIEEIANRTFSAFQASQPTGATVKKRKGPKT